LQTVTAELESLENVRQQYMQHREQIAKIDQLQSSLGFAETNLKEEEDTLHSIDIEYAKTIKEKENNINKKQQLEEQITVLSSTTSVQVKTDIKRLYNDVNSKVSQLKQDLKSTELKN